MHSQAMVSFTVSYIVKIILFGHSSHAHVSNPDHNLHSVIKWMLPFPWMQVGEEGIVTVIAGDSNPDKAAGDSTTESNLALDPILQQLAAITQV